MNSNSLLIQSQSKGALTGVFPCFDALSEGCERAFLSSYCLESLKRLCCLELRGPSLSFHDVFAPRSNQKYQASRADNHLFEAPKHPGAAMESQRHLEVFAFTLLVIAACSDPTKSDPETHLEPDLSKETQDLALDALLDQEEADIVDQQDADIEPEVEFHDDHSELQEMDSDVADSDVLDSDLGDAGTSPWDNSVAAASLNPCAPWQSSCDGICHNLTLDEAACGACDNPCAADQVCDLGSCQSPAPLAAPCSAEVLAEVLAPASDEAPRVLLTCSLTLAPEDVVSKKIRLAGPEASGVVIDCQGATLRPNLSSGGADAIQIVSQKIDTEPASWQRPTDIVVRNCRIEGSIRISGQALNGEGEDLRLDSLTLGHRERAQAAAPSRILLNQLTLIGQGRIPLYLSPGSTRVTLQDSENHRKKQLNLDLSRC